MYWIFLKWKEYWRNWHVHLQHQVLQLSKELLDYVKKGVKDETTTVLSGNNKEVEKRYKYYVDYG